MLDDVLAGFVSAEAAERDYGVKIVARAIDPKATARLRAARPLRSKDSGHAFDFGPERNGWDAVFTRDRMQALNDALMTRPPSQRQSLRQELFRCAVPELFDADARAARRVIPDPAASAERLEAATAELVKDHGAREA